MIKALPRQSGFGPVSGKDRPARAAAQAAGACRALAHRVPSHGAGTYPAVSGPPPTAPVLRPLPLTPDLAGAVSGAAPRPHRRGRHPRRSCGSRLSIPSAPTPDLAASTPSPGATLDLRPPYRQHHRPGFGWIGVRPGSAPLRRGRYLRRRPPAHTVSIPAPDSAGSASGPASPPCVGAAGLAAPGLPIASARPHRIKLDRSPAPLFFQAATSAGLAPALTQALGAPDLADGRTAPMPHHSDAATIPPR